MIVLFLTTMVAMIMMRTLHKDFRRYEKLENDDDSQDETGWKLVHGDVFRPPNRAMLLSVLVGTGVVCGLVHPDDLQACSDTHVFQQVLSMSVLTLGRVQSNGRLGYVFPFAHSLSIDRLQCLQCWDSCLLPTVVASLRHY